MIFPRQEYGSELPFPFSGYLPDPEVEPPSPASAGRFFTTEHRRSPCFRLDELVAQSCLTLCNPVDCMQPARLHCPWNSPGKNTEVGCHSLLQGIFLIQGSNSGPPHPGTEPKPPGKPQILNDLTKNKFSYASDQAYLFIVKIYIN